MALPSRLAKLKLFKHKDLWGLASWVRNWNLAQLTGDTPRMYKVMMPKLCIRCIERVLPASTWLLYFEE